MDTTYRFSVGGPRQPVYDYLRGLGFVMARESDKRWTRADGIEAHIFGAGSMVRVGADEMPLGELHNYLQGGMTMNERFTERDKLANYDKASAIADAFRIAHANGIAAYAIETRDGWIASDRKPSLRYGKVLECLDSGEVRHG